MDAVAVALLVAAAAAGFVNWWAVSGPGSVLQRRVESVAKPLTMTLLVGVAATAGSPGGGVRVALVVGAVLGLVGDVALLGDSEPRFMAGLGAFALGHLAYAAAALQVGWSAWALAGVAFMAVLLAVRFVTRILPGAKREGGSVLAGAVTFYGAVISVMVITAWAIFDTATPAWLAAVGAMSFAVSDWVLGHTKFAGPLPGGRLAVMVPYHLGQALLIVGVALA
ncbi:MAG TPA: lysoplasmalogenase [Ilumatobacter sp.]|nr:lysoplasmalogenase [Ilumatobacter sp.]